MPFSCITCTYIVRIVHDDVFIKDCEKQKGWTYHHHFSFKKEKTKYYQRKEILFPFFLWKKKSWIWFGPLQTKWYVNNSLVFSFKNLKKTFQGHQSWRGHFCGRTRGHRTQSHHITLLSELSQGIESERFSMSEMQPAGLRRNVRFWRRTHERMLYFFQPREKDSHWRFYQTKPYLLVNYNAESVENEERRSQKIWHNWTHDEPHGWTC